MELFTKVAVTPLRARISYDAGGVTLGSCFAQEMAARMRRARLPVHANPFGVLYNPASVAAAIGLLAAGRQFGPGELYHDGELWHSFAHHGSFSAPSADEALQAMNAAAAAGTQALRQAGWVAVTLGTAWVYERAGQVVANCHKLPASEFTRRRMSVEEIVETLGGAIRKYLADKDIILTVSPIRHIKYGLQENARSKAILMEAAHRICETVPRTEYFPAFEIMTDELRDYRFYGPDLAHPTAQAADHVWERFRDAATDAPTRELMGRVEQLASAASHRPLHPGTPSCQKFRAAMAARAGALQKEHPQIDLTREIEFFGR